MPPDIIAGRYRVEREVGRGGMGSVWLCRDERLGRPVAIKQVGGLPGESSLHLARALREARHSAALNHPNVVAIFDALEDGDHVWLVMEYVPSRTLDQIVREDGPLPPRVAAGIAADVADGLAAAHALGTVHRDVKPSNVLVREADGRALIADFGIARTVGQEQLTRSGLVTGTPTYFAPELARGAEPSPASDVWALGISVYVAVQGEPPYPEQSNAIALLNTIASHPAQPPPQAGPLATVMKHMLDPHPETRWTMARCAVALRAVAVTEPPAAPHVDPLPTPVRANRPPDAVPREVVAEPSAPRRRRVVPAVVALALLALLALLAGGGWWLTRDPGSGPRARPSASHPTTKATKKPHRHPSPTSAATAGGGSSPTSGASSSPPSQGPRPPSGSPSTAAPEGVPEGTADGSAEGTADGAAAGSPAELVEDYYSLLPEDTGSAWEMLTPALQDDIGEGTYEGFWATIDDVEVDGVRDLGEGLVQVTLTYVTDGRSEQETRQLGVDQVDGDYLIGEDYGAV